MFRVQRRQCSSCIYKPLSAMDIRRLEDEIRDPHGGGFKTYRICHHSVDVCCRGFWDRHKNKFDAGQIAQRLDLVQFVDVNLEPEDVMAMSHGLLSLLKGADLAKGVLNDVPMGTVFMLRDKGLIHWHTDATTTCGGTFPRHNNVRLTDFGLIVARRQQGKFHGSS